MARIASGTKWKPVRLLSTAIAILVVSGAQPLFTGCRLGVNPACYNSDVQDTVLELAQNQYDGLGIVNSLNALAGVENSLSAKSLSSIANFPADTAGDPIRIGEPGKLSGTLPWAGSKNLGQFPTAPLIACKATLVSRYTIKPAHGSEHNFKLKTEIHYVLRGAGQGDDFMISIYFDHEDIEAKRLKMQAAVLGN